MLVTQKCFNYFNARQRVLSDTDWALKECAEKTYCLAKQKKTRQTLSEIKMDE